MSARDIDELIGASCAQTEPELFFPPNGQPIAFEEAAKVCFDCPVREACLNQARARGEKFGVWGGVNFESDGSKEPFDPTAHGRCGTYSGHARHRKRGEDSCQPCRDARGAYDREARRLRNEGMSA